ncbi:hypothetical protein DFH28DRAFT_1084283 [Melampsora americana]|nr:hypothetical protein DFH28DRAFT_1084283 [Melampsora americana]
MESSESWPSQTCLANQTFAGARLKYNQNQSLHSEPRLDFEFARQRSELFIRSQVPLLQTVPPSVNKTDVPESTDPYRLLVSANRFLLDCYPEVDLPKELLLSHILEDQDQTRAYEINSASNLTGFSIGDQTSVFISIGSHLSNELYCSVMRYPFENEFDSIPTPRFIATARPTVTFPTPILQLANGPCLSFNGQASILARTFQSTFFFGSPQLNNVSSGVSANDEQIDFQSPPTKIDEPLPLITIPTSDTQKAIHVDACIGTARDGFTYGYIVDNQGGIWKTNDPANGPQCVQIGTITLTGEDEERIDWACSGTTFFQDCITVGLRGSVQVIDPRAGLEPTTVLFDSRHDYKNLYTLNENHLLTDIERHPNPLSPHLRLINTTQSLIFLDDRKPAVPLISIPHFRTQDLTLRMSFPSDLNIFSPNNGFNEAFTTPNPFVMLWSRKNDVASLLSLDRVQSDKPPAMIGFPTNVPVLSTKENNTRTGLVLTSFPNKNLTPNHLSIVEMTRDGALWQQVVSVEDQAIPSDTVTTSLTSFQRRVWDQDLFEREEEGRKLDQMSRQATPATKPSILADLSIICRDFDKIYTRMDQNETQSLSSDEDLRPSNFLTRRLDFAVHQTDPPIDHELLRAESQISQVDLNNETLLQNSQSSEKNHILDLMPTLTSVLYDPNDKLLNPVENHDEIEKLISNGINNSSRSKYKTSTRQMNQDSTRKESEEEDEIGVDAVERLMDQWKIGAPSSEYEWKDICIEDQEDEDEDELDTDYGRSSRRQTPLSGSQRSMYHNSVGFDYDTQYSEVRSKIEIGRAPSRLGSRKEPTTPRRQTHSMDFTSPFTTPFKESTHHQQDRSSPSHIPLNEDHHFHQSQTLTSNHHFGSLSQETLGRNSMAFSQVLPGPHADRSNIGHIKKKKRVGGF